MNESKPISCTIMRGGTSKGIFIMKHHLPIDPKIRDKTILSIFGSPDIRQIDGLGGADTLTSKLAIIAPSSRDDADIDYTFGQVDIAKPYVDYNSNCGNISSAVGPFSIIQGLVKVNEPISTIRIFNTNTQKVFTALVPVKDGMPVEAGNYSIDGVPGTGAKIEIDFASTIGSKTDALLPTGNTIDVLEVRNFGTLSVSMVDAGSPMVFVAASDINLIGTEMPERVDSDPDLLNLLENIRCAAAVRMGLTTTEEEARKKVRAIPLIAFVSAPQNYMARGSEKIVSENQVNFVSRVMFMQVMHKTYSVTATVCTVCAAVTNGTIVNKMLKIKGNDNIIRFGHPSGYIDAMVEMKNGVIARVIVGRTARRIMEGRVFVPVSALE